MVEFEVLGLRFSLKLLKTMKDQVHQRKYARSRKRPAIECVQGPLFMNAQSYDSSGRGALLMKISRNVSNVSQAAAMLGATFRRFGVMPLYNPLQPSCRRMDLTASNREVYW